MKKCFYSIALTLLFALFVVPGTFAQDVNTTNTDVETVKRAQTGMKFLSMSVDARSMALGSAVTSSWAGSSVSMFYNPASMAGMPTNFHLNVGLLQHITDINYTIGSFAWRPSGGNYGVFGLSVSAVDYGNFIGTIRSDNEAGYVETGNYSPTALSIGVGFARSFSDRFAAGVNVKFVTQDLGTFALDRQGSSTIAPGATGTTASYKANVIAFDFGVVYQTGWKSLNLGISARNFAKEVTYVRERFELPLMFQIGLSMNLLDFTSADPNMHQLLLTTDAVRPRDFAEHLAWGLEYKFMNIVALRGGFEYMGVQNEEQGVSLGAGVDLSFSGVRLNADYTYTDFGLFSSVNRIALQVGF